jgi:hypothetical protein
MSREPVARAYGTQVPFTQLAKELVQFTHVTPVFPHAVSAVPGWQVPKSAAEQQPPLHGVTFGTLHSAVQRSMPASRQAWPPLCPLAAGQSLSEPLHRHGPQSCGQVEQSSEGPHSVSPHTQLQGGDPPVQLQRPARQSAMTGFTQAPLACPLSPLEATSSLQAR